MAESGEVVRIAEARTVRLVSTARLRPSVLADLVPADELQALAEIEGATSGRLTSQQRGTIAIGADEFAGGVPHAAFINASFAYAKPRALNRFSGAGRGAWYAALDVATCLAEVKHHMTQELANVDRFEAVVDYAEMFASFAGEYLDLRAADPALDCLNPDPAIGYPAGNALAESVRAQGLYGVIYPSVRHPGGTCYAALWPHAVQSVAQGEIYRMAWKGRPEPDITKVDPPEG